MLSFPGLVRNYHEGKQREFIPDFNLVVRGLNKAI